MILALGDDLNLLARLLVFCGRLFLFWVQLIRPLEDVPPGRLAEAHHVIEVQLDIVVRLNLLLIDKGAMGAAQVVDQDIACVFVLDDCMAPGKGGIFEE